MIIDLSFYLYPLGYIIIRKQILFPFYSEELADVYVTHRKKGLTLAYKKWVYFVSLSSNVPYVLKDALKKAEQEMEVAIFFDLDGARVLDKRYVKIMERTHNMDLEKLLKTALKRGIKLYGCQMNVLIADGLVLVDGAELAGVATFLEKAYEADAVLSY
jgi:predicted peroxiredoxin